MSVDITLNGYYNRYDTDEKYKNYKRLLFRAQKVIQSAELNEMQEVIMGEVSKFASKLLVNGSIVSGCDVEKSTESAGFDASDAELLNYTFTCKKGIAFYNTFFIEVPDQEIKKLSQNPETFNDTLGVLVTYEEITEIEDPKLLNPAVESKNFGQPGAGRLKVTAQWTLESDVEPLVKENYFPLYTIKGGDVFVIVDPKPWMNDIKQIVAEYDRDANGNYVVEGFTLSYKEKDSDLGSFYLDIKEGTCNVYGFKFTTDSSQEIEIPPLVNFELKQGEPTTFNGNNFYSTRHYPIRKVYRISGVKEIQQEIQHVSASGGRDELPNQPVLSVIKVWSGNSDSNDTNNTFYSVGTDYVVDGDFIDWSPSGAEPAPGESYYAIYQYQYTETSDGGFSTDSVSGRQMGEISDDYLSVYLFGFVSGTLVQIDYDFVLQRTDLIYINSDGKLGVITGVPDEFSPQRPRIDNKGKLLQLGFVTLGENYDPKVENDSQRVFKMSDISDMLDAINELRYNVAKLGLMQVLKETQPSSIFKNSFVDDFSNDDLRDVDDDTNLGIINDAITADGNLILDTDWDNKDIGFYLDEDLPYLQIPTINKRLLIEQPYWTKTRLIDPFIYRKPPTPKVNIYPKIYRWISRKIYRTYFKNIQLADRRYFSWHWNFHGWRGSRTQTVGREIVSRTSNTHTSSWKDSPQIIPQINVHIWSDEQDFNNNEEVDIYFAEKLVKTTHANSNGKVDDTFTVPNGVYSGTKEVKLVGKTSTADGTTLFQAIPLVKLSTTIVKTYWRWIKRVNIWRWWWWDPTAQTFVMTETSPIHGVKVYFDKRPNTETKVLLMEVNAGVPNKDKTLAFKTFQPDELTIGDEGTYFEFPYKPTLVKDTEYAFVVMCEDAVGTIRVAKMGERDKTVGKWMTKQPYSEGVLLVSSNLSSWTPIQDEDMQFQIFVADFAESHTVEFNEVTVTNATDLLINAGVELQKNTSIYFNISLLDRAENNTFTNVSNNLPIPIGDSYTGRVKVEAVLEGDGDFSPNLEPTAVLSVGTTKNTSYYTSRQFDFPADCKIVDTYIDVYRPMNTAIILEYQDYDAGSDTYSWVALPEIPGDAKDLGNGWQELHFRLDNITPPDNLKTRIRITLSTTDIKYRPVVANLRTTLQEI